jgi:apolipoprotein D and lipocalin family protein
MRSSAAVLVGATFVFSGAVALTAQTTLRVVESVELARYAGKWFEIARLPNDFQKRCAADVVARYALRSDGRIDVVNQCRGADGQLVEARGIARKGNSQKNAVLQVRFAPAILSFLPSVWGDYWIIGLAPDYSWAVVGEPERKYLWILSRSPLMSGSSYQQALEIATANGFDVAKLARTQQKN